MNKQFIGVNYREYGGVIVVLTLVVIFLSASGRGRMDDGTNVVTMLIAFLDFFFVLRFVFGIRYYIVNGDVFCIKGLFGNKISEVLFDDIVRVDNFISAHNLKTYRNSYEGSTLKIQMKSGQILVIDMSDVRRYNELGAALKEKLGDDRFE